MASEIVNPEDIAAPCFFFSYARQETKSEKAADPYIRKFYNDLVTRLREDYGLERESEDIGFIDIEASKPGDDWSKNLREALRTAAVMIAAYSLPYFKSQYCGKEFYVFVHRQIQVEYDAEGKILHSEKILPILWSVTDSFATFDLPPEYLRQISYDLQTKDVKDVIRRIYLEYGLKEIIVRHQSKYHVLLQYFVRNIWQKLVKNPLPPTPVIPTLQETQNIFERHWEERRRKSTEREPFLKGPRTILLKYIVADQPLRVGHENYYKSEHEWCPFAPENAVPIQMLVRALADERELYLDDASSRIGSSQIVDPVDFLKALESATKQSLTVVLIIDPWSLLDDRTSSFLTTVMNSSRWRGGVIIPVYLFDQETREHVRPKVSQSWQTSMRAIEVEDRPASLGQFRVRFLELIARLGSEAVRAGDVRQQPMQTSRLSPPSLMNTSPSSE